MKHPRWLAGFLPLTVVIFTPRSVCVTLANPGPNATMSGHGGRLLPVAQAAFGNGGARASGPVFLGQMQQIDST